MQLTRRDLLILAAASVLVVLVYLVASVLAYRIGFPLDDAWIHQTYARNLALLHEWSFLPGQPSAGSTAPLWTFLLALGFFLPWAPYLWTYLLGCSLLFGLAALAENILRRAQPAYAPAYPWVGLFFVLEWHMAWASVSGMETILHILIVTATLGLLIAGSRRYLLLGLLTGLSVWVRPDGLTLLGPLLLYAVLVEKNLTGRAKALFRLLIGFAALFVPYLLFNRALSGTPMPNTFYAKQAEYVDWQNTPIQIRLLDFLVQFFAGSSLVVLPGFVQKVYRSFRRREWGLALSAIWVAGYLLLYVLRLPVYQHGRYLMPAMGVFLLIGVMGFVEALPSLRTYRTRLIRQAALATIVMFSLLFSVFGAYTFGSDVAFIESEMVESARWAARNIPPNALIAAHDIGALGFFGGHATLIDLAGLVSPEVVPFIRDQTRLASYMNAQGVDYLIAFPAWYPDLVRHGVPIFEARGRFFSSGGGENMTIYRWNRVLKLP